MRDRIRNGFRPKTSLYRPISMTPSCKIKNDTRTDELHYTVGAVHESLLKGCRLQFLQQVGHDGGNDAVVHGVKMSVTKAIIRLVFDLELSAIVILWLPNSSSGCTFSGSLNL